MPVSIAWSAGASAEPTRPTPARICDPHASATAVVNAAMRPARGSASASGTRSYRAVAAASVAYAPAAPAPTAARAACSCPYRARTASPAPKTSAEATAPMSTRSAGPIQPRFAASTKSRPMPSAVTAPPTIAKPRGPRSCHRSTSSPAVARVRGGGATGGAGARRRSARGQGGRPGRGTQRRRRPHRRLVDCDRRWLSRPRLRAPPRARGRGPRPARRAARRSAARSNRAAVVSPVPGASCSVILRPPGVVASPLGVKRRRRPAGSGPTLNRRRGRSRSFRGREKRRAAR